MLEAQASGAADIAGQQRIAVLVPCYNEEVSIAKVVGDFRAALPTATVYVYDNNSSDRTADVAVSAGAVVRHEPRQGKGRVVRRMFTDIDADIYVLVDGDATYDAPSAPKMIGRLLCDRLDMMVAVRVDREDAAYRPGHRLGNRLLTGSVAHIFGNIFTDMLSGYRVFTRRFVKSFPVLSGGSTRSNWNCRSARSAHPTTRGRRDRPPSCRPGPTAFASCSPFSRFIGPSARWRSSPPSGCRSASCRSAWRSRSSCPT